MAEIENYKRSLIYEYVTGKKEVPQVQHSSIVTFVDARALLMCRIIELLKPKGRIHLLKAMYSIDCLLGLNNETQYLRYTHGPYDARIEEYEKALIQKGWINVRQGSPVDYTLGANFEDYRQAYQAQFANVDVKIQKICAFLGPMKTSQTERIATLLAVWNDFILDGITPTDQQIVNEVRTNWTPNKAHSSEETWLGTLDKMRKNGFVPTGKGKHTASAN